MIEITPELTGAIKIVLATRVSLKSIHYIIRQHDDDGKEFHVATSFYGTWRLYTDLTKALQHFYNGEQ